MPTLLWINQSILWWGKKMHVFGPSLLGCTVVAATPHHECKQRVICTWLQTAWQPGLGDGARAGTISDLFGVRVNGTEH